METLLRWDRFTKYIIDLYVQEMFDLKPMYQVLFEDGSTHSTQIPHKEMQ